MDLGCLGEPQASLQLQWLADFGAEPVNSHKAVKFKANISLLLTTFTWNTIGGHHRDLQFHWTSL